MTALTSGEAMEQSTRRALRWGGGLLVLGLGAVGVGAPAQGGPVALAGLLATIYAIHRFGRLGPDDGAALDPTGYAATDVMWLGGLALVAGVAFVVGGGDGPGAYAVLAGGAAAFAWGYRRRGATPETAPRAGAKTVVPDADDRSERPRPKRRRARPKE
jgi:hypothetical protein